MLTTFVDEARLWVSPDDVKDPETLPDTARMTWLDGGRFVVAAGERAVLSASLEGAEGTPLANVDPIRSFGAARQRQPGALGTLDAMLDVSGLSRLEVGMNFVLVERTEPRTEYPG